jgi:hypothetical protein
LVALCWGLLAGLVICVPAGYAYRFWRQSAPLRANQDYTRLSVAGINDDWNLFQQLEKRNTFLGELSPAKKLSAGMRSSLMHAADDVIERYRNNSDPAIEDFDWEKAAVCLRHVLEIDRADRTAEGRLAVSESRACAGGGRSSEVPAICFPDSTRPGSAPRTSANLHLFAEECRQGDR